MTDTDWRVETIVSLENLIRDARALKEKIGEELRREQRIWHQVEKQMRENPVAIPCATHAFCELRSSGGICSDDEPPGRPV